MRNLMIAAACFSVSACESTIPPPEPFALIASLNGNNIPLDAAKVAPPHEAALCVHATDSLIAKGNWDFQKPISVYWNQQFAAHSPAEGERAQRMEDAISALQPYPDAQSNLHVQIALVSRCDRAMKAALGEGAPG